MWAACTAAPLSFGQGPLQVVVQASVSLLAQVCRDSQGSRGRGYCCRCFCLTQQGIPSGDHDHITATSCGAWALSWVAVCVWMFLFVLHMASGLLLRPAANNVRWVLAGPHPASCRAQTSISGQVLVKAEEALGCTAAALQVTSKISHVVAATSGALPHCGKPGRPCRRGGVLTVSGLARHGAPDDVWAAELHKWASAAPMQRMPPCCRSEASSTWGTGSESDEETPGKPPTRTLSSIAKETSAAATKSGLT